MTYTPIYKEAERIRVALHNSWYSDDSILHAMIKKVMHLPEDEPITDIDSIMDIVYYVLNEPNGARHITVDDLPKEPRRAFSKKIKPDARAKKQSKYIERAQRGKWDAAKREWVYSHGSITHIATGKVWNATTGATPDEFMKVM